MLFGQSKKEKLLSAIREANSAMEEIYSLCGRNTSRISTLSYSDKNRIRSLMQKFLMSQMKVPSLIEGDTSLMMTTVPGPLGSPQIPCYAWLQWAMQAFEGVERYL